MGFAIVTLGELEISDWKKPVWTGLNQFVWTSQKLLIDEKGVVKQNCNFLWFIAHLQLNIIW